MDKASPRGKFTCAVAFEIVRAPNPVRKEEGGATYIVQRDYELAFLTVLRFANGAELPIRAKLFGELSQKVVIRDARGTPVQMSGYTQGRSEISDADGNLIFEGRYYDTRVTQALAGDDAFTPIGTRICDHWVNGFGRGAFAGHAFSLGVHLTREGSAEFAGQANGQID